MDRPYTVEEAYLKWSDGLVRYATALVGPADAPDLVADVFVTLINRGEATWADVRDPQPYLFRSVTNAARMRARGRARSRVRDTRWSNLPAAGELLGDPTVLSALNQLSVQQRAAMFLTYWEDLDPAAVAEHLGVSQGSVKRHLARGRSALREVLT